MPGTSTSCLTDLPTHLSGWFSHTFSTSTTDLSLPSLLASTSSTSSQYYFTNSTSNVSPGTSPKLSVGADALLTATKHGKGHLDKGMRYLLDSDAMPDKCTDPIWILGVKHPGWEPPPPSNTLTTTASLSPSFQSSTKSMRSSVSSVSDATQGQGGGKPGGIQWPPIFDADFPSQILLTYLSHFTPIQDVQRGDLDGVDAASLSLLVSVSGSAVGTYSSSSSKTDASARGRKKEKEEGSSSPVIGQGPWTWGGGGASAEKGWTSDLGWGCMLRTGRDWRCPPHPILTADYAMYVQILTWFLDTPAPEAPFSVHWMALPREELGKDVGQWSGPSTAAGAIKTLSEVFTFATSVSATRHQKGLTGTLVNPIYYETIKAVYVVHVPLADNLFYLDPHHARPVVALRPAPPPPCTPPPTPPHQGHHSHETEMTPDESEAGSAYSGHKRKTPLNHASTNSPSSVRTGSSTFSYHTPLSPSPLQQEVSTSGKGTESKNRLKASLSSSIKQPRPHTQPNLSTHSNTARLRSASVSVSSTYSEALHENDLSMFTGGGVLDPVQEHYVTAYPVAELKTYHCERLGRCLLVGWIQETGWGASEDRVLGTGGTTFVAVGCR
ncbi:Cysteine protease ATG4 [Termitomyces sp. T112]|nr:Cysteine protease ATG4 [Termitomyces sp. T112]